MLTLRAQCTYREAPIGEHRALARVAVRANVLCRPYVSTKVSLYIGKIDIPRVRVPRFRMRATVAVTQHSTRRTRRAKSSKKFAFLHIIPADPPTSLRLSLSLSLSLLCSCPLSLSRSLIFLSILGRPHNVVFSRGSFLVLLFPASSSSSLFSSPFPAPPHVLYISASSRTPLGSPSRCRAVELPLGRA